MIIEKATPADIPVLLEIWKESFGDSETFINTFFRTCPTENSRCVRMDGRPVAALYWFDCDYKGKRLAYIYAVATDKAYRGRGLCRSLMTATHQHLQASGYSGAVLAPGNARLFSMYGAMGYRSFSPMSLITAFDGEPIVLEQIDGEAYFRFRNQYLSANGILQDSVLPFLRCFTEFYGNGDLAVCVTRDGDTLLFQEFLGDPAEAEGVIAGLGAKKGIFRYPDPAGSPRSMYLSFDGTELKDAYLGIFMD